MAIITGQLEVSTTRVQIDGSSTNPFKIIVHNASNSDNIYMGNENVTAATGLELHSHAYVTFEMPAGERLFAISSTGTHTLTWMQIA
jgi:hypothetical protein